MAPDGAWTYVFGDLDPDTGARRAGRGCPPSRRRRRRLMPWRGRPDALKRGLIARVPPLDFQETE